MSDNSNEDKNEFQENKYVPDYLYNFVRYNPANLQMSLYESILPTPTRKFKKFIARTQTTTLNNATVKKIRTSSHTFDSVEEIVIVDPSTNAVPELIDPPDELSIALLQTERTTANVHTSNSDQRRFFQDSDMRDPLIEVYEKPIFTKSRI